MKRIATAGIAGGIVFAICWFAASIIFQSRGPHAWGDAQRALARLQVCTEMYRAKHGHPPDARGLNNEIEHAWRAKAPWSDPITPDLDDDLVLVLSLVATDYHLRVWERPPKFVVDTNRGSGGGFYLDGEDQKSATNGRDPNDVNSWDSTSADFYFRRLNQQRNLRNGLLALPPALIVGWIAWKRTNRPTSQRIRQR